MCNRVITISREFGSGGRTIGKLLSKKLNIPCYDEELLDKIEEKSGFSKEYIAELGEDATSGNWIEAVIAARDYNGHSYQNDLYTIQESTILELAAESSCIIVGRCADYILRNNPNCLHVFIYADIQSREKRIIEEYGESFEHARKHLHDIDKRRAAYYHLHTDTKWADVHNYNITLDSGTLGIEKCVEILAALY